MSWFPVLLVVHIALAVSVFLPSVLLPFALRTGSRGQERAPRRVTAGLLAMQGTGTLVIGGALRWAALGMAAGGVAALGLSQLLSRLLYGVGPSDPATFGSVALLLAAVVLAACVFPARNALRVDPNTVLRD
jgi:hypothetical protein